jgi:hypothetical protein
MIQLINCSKLLTILAAFSGLDAIASFITPPFDLPQTHIQFSHFPHGSINHHHFLLFVCLLWKPTVMDTFLIAPLGAKGIDTKSRRNAVSKDEKMKLHRKEMVTKRIMGFMGFSLNTGVFDFRQLFLVNRSFYRRFLSKRVMFLWGSSTIHSALALVHEVSLEVFLRVHITSMSSMAIFDGCKVSLTTESRAFFLRSERD